MSVAVAVLAILGDPPRFATVVDWIRRRKQSMSIATSAGDGLRVHAEVGADLVLVGLPLPDRTSAEVMGQLRRQDPRVPIVVVGTDADIRTRTNASDLGASEYVADPASNEQELRLALGVALGIRTDDAQLRFLRGKDAAGTEWKTLLGDSPAMRQVATTLRAVCDRTGGGVAPTVLLTGETGTGKGLIAKTIHYNCARRSRPFVDINCAAIAPNLLESELFGHEKGAFTDARSTRVGLFETGNGGTVFLDEIGAMPLELQAKLLTVLEEKRVRRVGGNTPIQVDVQIIAATHADLAAMVKRNEFRADLFHRLNVIALELPPLRDRGDDVIHLAEQLIASLAADYGIAPPHLADTARAAICKHDWPGNVRELRNELERIVLLVDTDTIRAEHFRFAPGVREPDSIAVEAQNGGLLVTLTGDACPLEDLEREVIRQALLRHRGNVSRTARFLAVSRQTLVYRLKKYGFQTSTNPGLEDESAR